jgi:hypothetical protein
MSSPWVDITYSHSTLQWSNCANLYTDCQAECHTSHYVIWNPNMYLSLSLHFPDTIVMPPQQSAILPSFLMYYFWFVLVDQTTFQPHGTRFGMSFTPGVDSFGDSIYELLEKVKEMRSYDLSCIDAA